jgi:hypothetical protein
MSQNRANQWQSQNFRSRGAKLKIKVEHNLIKNTKKYY